MRFNRGLIVFSLLVVVALAVACGPSEPKADPAVEAEWAALTEAKEKLDSRRAELDELKAMMMTRSEEEEEEEEAEVGEETEPAEGEEAEAMETPEEMAARAEEFDKEIADLADKFGGRLAAFLNDPANQIIEGEPLTERQVAAVRMKSSEDIELAAEYVEKGGDYRRAIDILQVALQLDPDNADVQVALEEAQANRYMSEERFALAKKGMTQDEIRETLGQVNLRNIRDYPEKKVVAWFYATAEGGAAAGVYFNEDKRSGEMKVYQLKYDAVGGPEDG
ncbi:MAG: hypothetical protein GY769_11795 [bacterium]|nr:hypothetical protein [bacterium]